MRNQSIRLRVKSDNPQVPDCVVIVHASCIEVRLDVPGAHSALLPPSQAKALARVLAGMCRPGEGSRLAVVLNTCAQVIHRVDDDQMTWESAATLLALVT